MTFKVGDKVRIVKDVYSGLEGVIGDVGVIRGFHTDPLGEQYGFDVVFKEMERHYFSSDSLTPYTPVPIGYTGKLKDMDLQEGDVVTQTYGKHTVTNGTVCDRGLDYWTIDFTLISRANQWSNWHMSRKDGSYDTQSSREYETNPLPDTDQVTYRWRDVVVKEPVVKWEECDVKVNGINLDYIEVKLTDGYPDPSTVRYSPQF